MGFFANAILCSWYEFPVKREHLRGIVGILTPADSRTSYATERRTYSSTTGAYGGSNMGGK